MDKKIPPHKEVALSEINANYKGNSATQQCERLLAGLRLFSLNTFEASRALSIYYPPARIFTLREQGHPIDTIWETIIDENGGRHRVGCYVLRRSI